MHDADIIEISSGTSSPLAEDLILPKSFQKRDKGKGKMKAIEVIELTDDDDSDAEIQLSQPTPMNSQSRNLKSSQKKKTRPIVIDDLSDNGDVVMVESGNSSQSPSNRTSFKESRPKMHLDASSDTTRVITEGFTEQGEGEISTSRRRLSNSPTTSELGTRGENDLLHLPFPVSSPVPSISDLHAVSIPSSSTAAPDTSSSNAHQPPKPTPLLETPEQAMARYIARISEIVQDVDPDYCASLVADHQRLGDATIERVLHILLEDSSYPRIKRGNVDKGKRKADGACDGSKRPNKKAKGNNPEDDADDLFLSTERPFVGGIFYHDLAINRLQEEYPFIPKLYLRGRLLAHRGFYAPTYFFLRDLDRKLTDGTISRDDCPYVRRKTLYKPPHGKGKQRDLQDNEFEREFSWVKEVVRIEEEGGVATQADNAGDDASPSDDDDSDIDKGEESDGEDEENGIECGCCFTRYRFDKMIQCPDAHLFCLSCLRSYAGTLLGSHNPNITCMSQSICSCTFAPSQLARVLPRKTYALYERLIQAKEIDAAGLEGLEECPFCEWKCVMEVDFEGEKLFRCGNDIGGCGVVSCRKCKKLDHLPKSCEEMEQDKKLDARHLVEEAMTQALMRNCPKCKKAFIKDSGCNKMTCPNCHTLSCYICRQIITGYDHFNQNPNQPSTSVNSNSKKCVLWDKDLEKMHANEVKSAADQAIAEARLLHPDVSLSDLKVDLQKAKKSTVQQRHVPPAPVFNGRGPIPPLIPPAPRAGRGGRRGRRNNQVAQLPAHPPPPPPHYYHQVPQHRPEPAPQLQIPPYRPPDHAFFPQRPPVAPAAVLRERMGRYQPVEGGVEVGGRILRAHAGRPVNDANRQLPLVGAGGGAMAGPAPVANPQFHALAAAVNGANGAFDHAAWAIQKNAEMQRMLHDQMHRQMEQHRQDMLRQQDIFHQHIRDFRDQRAGDFRRDFVQDGNREQIILDGMHRQQEVIQRLAGGPPGAPPAFGAMGAGPHNGIPHPQPDQVGRHKRRRV